MTEFNKYVPFLEASDFENGTLNIAKIEQKFKSGVDPSRVRHGNYIVICLAKATWCGHCVHFMPDFAQFAKNEEEKLNTEETVIRCVAIEQTDKDAFNAFTKQIKEIQGFPTVIAFNADGHFIKQEHKGQRDVDGLSNYANKCVVEGYKEPVSLKKRKTI